MNKNNWKFHNPTKIIFGTGTLAHLRNEVWAYGSHRNVMLICGRKALRQSGYLGKAIKLLKGKKIALVDKVEPNPEISFIDDIVHYAREKKVEIVVGLGGGSVIDTAKVVALLADKRYLLRTILDRNIQIETKGSMCIAMPTTAGTGSEVTPTSSVWKKATGSKLTLVSKSMFPDVAIVDPLLTLSLGPYQTAVTGLDTLSHAVESYWSKKSFGLSRVFSLAATKLVFSNLKRVFKKPKDIKARETMSLASLYAGLAISNTGTTAGHAISYYLTARFNIAHGLACALSLPYLIRHNGRSSWDYFKPLVRTAGFSNMNQFADGVKKLIEDLELSVSLKEYGITEEDLAQMQQRSFATNNITNNCVRLNKSDLMTILEKML